MYHKIPQPSGVDFKKINGKLLDWRNVLVAAGKRRIPDLSASGVQAIIEVGLDRTFITGL